MTLRNTSSTDYILINKQSLKIIIVRWNLQEISHKRLWQTNLLIANSKPSLSKWREKKKEKMGISKSHKLPNIFVRDRR